MKLNKILFFFLLINSCSKDNVDTSPKKVIKCNEWAFEYDGEKLSQIIYKNNGGYKIKFLYIDSIITNIEYYRNGQLDKRTYLLYEGKNLIAEIDTTYQEHNRYEQEIREYKYLTENEVELRVSSNHTNDTTLQVRWNKKYFYKNENLIEITTGNRTDKIEYDNLINPFYYVTGLKKLKYFSLRGETILLNTKNNCIKYNSLEQKIVYNTRNQPLKYIWSNDIYEQYQY